MPDPVVGRDAELASIRDFVTGIPDGASALVLEGEAGMGKTTLWRAAVEQADAGGFVVLAVLPAESETALSFAGLGDLLDPVLARALDPLPALQRAALSRALLLDDLEGAVPDPHAVGVALLNAIRALSESDALLVCVDDVQWLDDASAAALAYAVRRLRTERVGVLFARRTGLTSGLANELRRSLGDRVVTVEVGPLDAAALHGVIRDRLGSTLPRPLLTEVHEASGGNPFYALEIVRALAREGVSVEAGRPLPVPGSLHGAVHARILALPDESRDFVAAAAAHAHPTVDITEAASGVPAARGLTPALDAQIVELDRNRIRFTHPLFAAGAYETADPTRRKDIHLRLAELLVDPEARAWQLAASVGQPDERVAAVLEDAAEHARSRGALRAAALLFDRARELTPTGLEDDALRRGVDASYLHFEAGDSSRAEGTLRDLIADGARGLIRARALCVLGRIRSYDSPEEAVDLFLEVIDGFDGDPETLAKAHEGVASSLYIHARRFEEGIRHAQAAVALALELGDQALAGDALISQLGGETWLGSTSAASTAERALDMQKDASGNRANDQPLIGLVEYWHFIGEGRRARRAIQQLSESADELGDESSRPYLLFLSSTVESALGNPSRALGLAREGREAAEQSGQPVYVAYNLAREACELVHLGSRVQAMDARRRALELAPTNGYVELLAAYALGQHDLTAGAPDKVVANLSQLVPIVQREGIVEPEAARFVVDLIEALIELGRRDEAVELLDWYEGNARRLERASALANCARCRGMLAAQAGTPDAAFAAYEEALNWHATIELPLDRGRTLLALGAAQRRAKRRREARATLEEALALFVRIGAALWAERARAALSRISGRAATPGALTPAEERVAALVAEGKTNREVAAALFLSDRTVEWHLSHIFGKLGIRHRAQLGAALAAHLIPGVDVSNTGDSPVSAESIAP